MSTCVAIVRLMSTREDLLLAAEALLNEGGPTAVTLRGVGKAAGVSHNAPYHHFENKSALLAAVAARELEARAEIWREAASTDDGIRCALVTFAKRAMERPHLFRLVYATFAEPGDQLPAAAAVAASAFATAVLAAQARKELPSGDPGRIGALMLAALHGAVSLAGSGHLAKHGGADPVLLIHDLLDRLRLS